MTAPWEPTPREPDCECGHPEEDHAFVGNSGGKLCRICKCSAYWPNAAYWLTRAREFGMVSR